MHNSDDRSGSRFGRKILDHLSENLSKHTKHRQENPSENQRSEGFVGNFSEGLTNTSVNEGFIRSRKFSSHDLQLLLLALLANKSAHGYELIKALETRSNGFYSPSPGMIYPALTHLDELEQITVTLDGNRKCYALSEVGKQRLFENQERVDLMWLKLTQVARKMDSVRRAYSLDSDLDDNDAWVPELVEARQLLKNALLHCDNTSIAEQRRVAEVLLHAARTILKK